MKQLNEVCGCCEGIEIITPQPTQNRPGLSGLSYRVGTHATFLETMLARLSSADFPKLAELTTRESDDPAIALLDAWATVADVLTFYNERIINENYLRTATERRSVLELARLVGYQLRPGLASSVYLAYTLDDNSKEEIVIPKGTRSQSIPGPGEFPQSFETSEALKARAKWNNLKPRMTQPQTENSIRRGDGKFARVYLKGLSTSLKPNDPLLIDFGNGRPEFHRVKDLILDAAANRTLVVLQKEATENQKGHDTLPTASALIGNLTLPPSTQVANSLKLERNFAGLFSGTFKENKSSASMVRAGSLTNLMSSSSLNNSLAAGEASHAALKAFAPVLNTTLGMAIANAEVTENNPIKVYALKTTSPVFGHNSPKKILQLERATGKILEVGEWPIVELGKTPIDEVNEPLNGTIRHEQDDILYLNSSYEKILPRTWVVIDTSGVPTDLKAQVLPANGPILISRIKHIQSGISRADYGITGSTTRIELSDSWIKFFNVDAPAQVLADRDFQMLRRTLVYAQSEELELAEEPIEKAVCGGTDELLELDGFYEGLESGRWVIVAGERDIPGTAGVKFSELAMIASVTQDIGTQIKIPEIQSTKDPSIKTETSLQVLPGDKMRTFIRLANKLAYCFKRETITIYGNVVKATHGETRQEVLGSGNAAKPLQAFTLKQAPLTFVSAANPSGADSSLRVWVNHIEWHEENTFVGLRATDRNFITKTDDDGKPRIIFGNGRAGARLPTGAENIRAEYRSGIGKMGNVDANKISLLMTKPLGVKEVTNPLRASGGADKESLEQARKNVSLALKALDRLVSVQDYEDFARTYAGIGKARATEISAGRRQLVHITIAGADDIPIDRNSDLYRNLRRSLLDYGDPYQSIQLDVRELMLIVIQARIKILPGYQWEVVALEVRVALLDAFSFEKRELGQDVLLSEVMRVIQGVRGVAYVDIDAFGGIPEKVMDEVRRLLTPQEIAVRVSQMIMGKLESRLRVNLAGYKDSKGNIEQNRSGNIVIHPAQLAFITPEVPDTLVLNQIS